MKVKLTQRAEKRVEIVDRFWRKNRLEVPDLLKEELAAAETQQDLIVVQTIWGARRGRDPKL